MFCFSDVALDVDSDSGAELIPIMVERPTCIDCGATAPDTDTNYTLISSSFGWRLTRRVGADGSRAAEWRCPNCWNKHKVHDHKTHGPPPSSGPSAPQPARKPLSRAVGDPSSGDDGDTHAADKTPPPRRK
jgi:hypothetical protein